MNADQIKKELRSLADPEIARHSSRFFKSGPGEYGEGDQFLGIRVPPQRKVAKKYQLLPLPEIKKLLQSGYHEERLTALLILVYQYQKADEADRESIYHFYTSYTQHINNWDLVDSSAPQIVGRQLQNRSREILYDYALSGNIWERRMAITATLHFIKQGELDETFKIADILLQDEQDLIHKAVGWMLREAGKQDPKALRDFLKLRYRSMPRIMLRYAIEKFPSSERQAYLKGDKKQSGTE